MDIYNSAYDSALWEEYFQHIVTAGHRASREVRYLRQYIDNHKYLEILEKLANGEPFARPHKILINKKGTAKKRTVFAFPAAENELLRFFGYQLHVYDKLFAKNLYSFVQGRSVKNAIDYLAKKQNISNMYVLKLDIHDYFNSVDVKLLLPELARVLEGQGKLYALFENILLNPEAIWEGQVETVTKGIIAGSPLSPFLANLYLSELDHHFLAARVLYARYADDMILFTGTEDELNNNYQYLCNFLDRRCLTLNPKKILRVAPGEPWEFLGFSFENGTIDISRVALEKMKAKARRKARSIYRWRLRKQATVDQAVRVFIRYFNRKIFNNDQPDELTWARWYFPLINSAGRLHEIDLYMQECIRYVATGKHNKAAYNYRYEQMKANGYRSLVNEFFSKRGHEAE